MNEKINYDNCKFGMLTVLYDGKGIYEGNKKRRSVICKCDCGNEKEVILKNIKQGKIKSCGCLTSIKNKINPGDIFNNWTVIKEGNGYIYKNKKQNRTFSVRCVCGKIKEVHIRTLISGESKSCGCGGKIREQKIKKEKVLPKNTEEEKWKQSNLSPNYYISTIGRLYNLNREYILPKNKVYKICNKKVYIIQEMYKTFIGNFDKETHRVILEGELNIKNLYLIERPTNTSRRLQSMYNSIKHRCNNPNSKDYHNYGGRGIKIEESFNTFNKFYTWAISNGYELNKKLEIDRINNNENYSVDNCRFVLRKDNNRNTRRNVMNWEIVNEIRYGKLKNESNKTLSEKFNCCISTIKNVRNFKTWNL